MKFSKEYINISPLTFAVVNVWKQPLSSLPSFSQEFNKNIFSNPPSTNHQITQAGLTISEIFPPQMKNGIIYPPVSNILHYGFDRFTIRHSKLENILDVYSKFHQELLKLSPGIQNHPIGQLGINIEFEVSIADFKIEKLFKRLLDLPEPNSDFSRILGSEIKYQIHENTAGKFVNITMQPRMLSENMVYFLMNDHFSDDGRRTLLNPSDFKTTIEKSLEKFGTKVLPFLFKL